MLYIYLLQQTQQWYILAHDDWFGDDAILKEASLSSKAFCLCMKGLHRRSKVCTGGSVTLYVHICRRLRRQEKQRSVTW